VRAIVAMNRHTLPDTLTRLASDSDTRVRQLVASNPNSTEVVWVLLSVDPDPIVRRIAHRDLLPPVESRRQVATQDETRPELVELLAVDPDYEVRLAVARRPDAPTTVLDRLIEDRSW